MYKLLLIWRYFRKRRVAWVAVGAVSLIVMMVVVVLNVMAGLLAETRQQNHRWCGDVVISRDSLVGFAYYEVFIKELGTLIEVKRATPVLRSYGLSMLGSGQVYGVKLEEFCSVTDFAASLSYQKDAGNPTFAVPGQSKESGNTLTAEQQQRGCIVGCYALSHDLEELATLREMGRLAPGAQLGLNLTVFAVNSRGALAGAGLGQTQKFWYVDDSESGLVDIDLVAIYVDFDQLQKLCAMDGSDGDPARAHEIRIKLAEGVDPAKGLAAIENIWTDFARRYADQPSGSLLADVKVQDWSAFRRSFIAPVEKEKTMMTLVFGLLSLVAVFIIFAIFYMIVAEKIKDLGILRSVGASRLELSVIFLGFGLVIGLTGAILGGVVGALVVRNSNEIASMFNISIWDPDLYAIAAIPSTVYLGQTVWIGLFAAAAAVLGAAIPARRAGKLEVVEALRVE